MRSISKFLNHLWFINGGGAVGSNHLSDQLRTGSNKKTKTRAHIKKQHLRRNKHCSVYILIALFWSGCLHLNVSFVGHVDDVTGLAQQVFNFYFFNGILQSTLPNKINIQMKTTRPKQGNAYFFLNVVS